MTDELAGAAGGPPAPRPGYRLTAKVGDLLASFVVSSLPHAPGANRLKRWAMVWRGARVGRGVKIWSGVWIDRFDGLAIGDGVTIGKDVMMIAGGTICIGDRTMVGHGSKLISVGHRIPSGRQPMRFSGPESAPVRIEKDAWISAQSVLLPGVTIGEGAVVAAGAVVTREVEPYAVVGGVPARLIRRRT